MIQEEKKDLVDRQEFYRKMAQRMSEKDCNLTLNSSLTLREILEILTNCQCRMNLMLCGF